MSIEFIASTKTFFLHAQDTTYAFTIDSQFGGRPTHLYWGPRLATQDLRHLHEVRHRPFVNSIVSKENSASLDLLPQEFPVYGTSDYRSPAIEVWQPKDGSRVVDLRYTGHTISAGKPKLEGLPATFAGDDEAQTLTVTLEDALLGLRVELLYTAFANHSVITRSARLINSGAQTLDLRRVLSCSVDFSTDFADYQFLHLSGYWARERHLHCQPLRPGTQSIESRRGASGHQHNPFFALAERGADEEHGQVYGFNFVYSGNFLANVEVSFDGNPRAQLGINPFDFSWQLEPGGAFQAPEAVLAYSNNGLGELSRTLHRCYRRHLCRDNQRNHPVIINNWEATYFDFNAEKLEQLAVVAADVGIELFVLDDGWFGHRDDDHTSLGDWIVDRKKLPNGLDDLVRRVNAKGLEFGLWFEPEMISADSDLYRAHPDWCLHVPGRQRTEGRQQLVLDFSRAEVRDTIYQSIAAILRSAPITYVKWDMNRHMTEIASATAEPQRQAETAHRYMLGLYDMMEKFVSEFPHILFEGCSGGGGRFDPGILYYMPQIWCSDDTDAVARLKIQHGTSIPYPLTSISAHFSVVPNHQLRRSAPAATRGAVAFTGAFGYELDLTQLGADELAVIAQQTAQYKELRHLIVSGDLYRLISPFDGQRASWMVVSPGRDEALVTHVHILIEPNLGHHYLRLRGLDPAKTYRLTGSGETYRGDALMSAGLLLPLPVGDFATVQWHFKAV